MKNGTVQKSLKLSGEKGDLNRYHPATGLTRSRKANTNTMGSLDRMFAQQLHICISDTTCIPTKTAGPDYISIIYDSGSSGFFIPEHNNT